MYSIVIVQHMRDIRNYTCENEKKNKKKNKKKEVIIAYVIVHKDMSGKQYILS